MSNWDHAADRKAASNVLTLSRRTSDAVRARAAELDKPAFRFLELVIREGLAATEHLKPRPTQQRDHDRTDEDA